MKANENNLDIHNYTLFPICTLCFPICLIVTRTGQFVAHGDRQNEATQS